MHDELKKQLHAAGLAGAEHHAQAAAAGGFDVLALLRILAAVAASPQAAAIMSLIQAWLDSHKKPPAEAQ